jgi:hypothetical protein
VSIRRVNYIKPKSVKPDPVKISKGLDANIKKSIDDRAVRDRAEALKRNREQKRVINEKIQTSYKKPQEKYNYVPIPKIWENETVYIIGGGASLKGFNFSRLAGKKVIALNKAYQYYENCDVLYWTDSRFYVWYKKEIDRLSCLKFTPARHNKDLAPDVSIVRISGERKMDFENNNMISSGNNSGFGAIGLAYKLGARKIFLLGYDMGFTNGQSHFHDGYDLVKAKEHIYKTMLKTFVDNSEVIKKYVEIYNVNPQSELRCFKFCTMDWALSS